MTYKEIKELKKLDRKYTNEEVSEVMKYFHEHYGVKYGFWADKVGVDRRTIYRIRDLETNVMTEKNSKKISILVQRMLIKFNI